MFDNLIKNPFSTPASSPTLGQADPYADSGGDWLLPTTSRTDSLPKVGTSSLNTITGTLGKAFDTFLDAAAVAGANKIIGTSYPTGQQSPDAVAAQKQATVQNQAAQSPFNWQPLAIGGGILLVGLIAAAVILRRK